MEVNEKQLENVLKHLEDLGDPFDTVLDILGKDGTLTALVDIDIPEHEKSLKDLVKTKESFIKKATSILEKAKKSWISEEQNVQKQISNVENSADIKELTKDYKAAVKEFDTDLKTRKKDIAEEIKGKLEEAKADYEALVEEIKQEQIDQEKEADEEIANEVAELTTEYNQNVAETKKDLEISYKESLKESIIDLLRETFDKYDEMEINITPIPIDENNSVENLVKMLDKQFNNVLVAINEYEKESKEEIDQLLDDAKKEEKHTIDLALSDIHQNIEQPLNQSDMKQVADWMQHKKKDVPNASSLEDVPTIQSVLDSIHKLKPALEKILHDGTESSVKAAEKIWLDIYKKYTLIRLWCEYWLDTMQSGKESDTHELQKGKIKAEDKIIDKNLACIVEQLIS